MSLNQEPIPYNDAITDPKTGLITDEWTRYFNNTLLPQITAATKVVDTYTTGVVGVNAAIPITPVVESATQGQYRFTHYLQCLTPAGVASAFQVTLTWTFNNIVQTQTFSNVNGNLTTTHEGVEYPIHTDGGTPISVAVTYASNPAAAAVYFFEANVELVQAD
jgi:hypothetical protein